MPLGLSFPNVLPGYLKSPAGVAGSHPGCRRRSCRPEPSAISSTQTVVALTQMPLALLFEESRSEVLGRVALLVGHPVGVDLPVLAVHHEHGLSVGRDAEGIVVSCVGQGIEVAAGVSGPIPAVGVDFVVIALSDTQTVLALAQTPRAGHWRRPGRSLVPRTGIPGPSVPPPWRRWSGVPPRNRPRR